MEKIKFRVLGNQIEVVERPAVITSGTVGLEAEFTFDSRWDSLAKTLVFKAGEKIIATALAGDTHSVPWEVLETPHQWLCVGVYGANRDGTVVIPTLWVKVAVIHTGTEPEGDPALEPSTPIWQEAVYLAERGAAAIEKAVADWAPELCPGLDNPELTDIVNELVVCDRHMDHILNEHLYEQENPHEITCQKIGAVTKEQHDKDIQDTKDIAWAWAETAQETALQEIADRMDEVAYFYYKKTEVDAKIAETKAVIVTVSNNVPSHTSQEIYDLMEEGKVVYLSYSGNYILCSSATSAEAKFESSFMTTITGADGKSYATQYFRLYVVKGEKFGPSSKIMASQEYVDAMIEHYLNQ